MEMKWWNRILISSVLLSAGWTAPNTFASEDPLRLPKTSKPLHYDLALSLVNLDLGDRTFEGSVTILINILEETNKLTLHNRGLAIIDKRLINSRDRNILRLSEPETDKEFVHFHSSMTLLKGENITLELTFVGQLRNDVLGFYRSSYKTADNEIR